MMNKKSRLFSGLMILVTVFTLFSGCASKPYVMAVDGMKLRQGIYAYYYGYNYAAYYESNGDSAVTYQTTTSVFQHVAIYRLFEAFGLKLDDADKTQIENLRTAKINELGGQGGYAQFLKTVGLTDKLYRDILAVSPMYNKVKEHLYGEGGEEYISREEIRQIYADLYAHEVHIFISTANVETAQEQDELYARAQEAHSRLAAGASFTDMIAEYGEDSYMATYPEDGYYLAPGDSGSDEIDAALFALEIGGISDIITTPQGFLILKRLPVEDDYLDSVFADGSMYDSYIDTTFTYYIMEAMTKYDPEYFPEFFEVDFTTAAAAFITSAQS